MKTLYTVFDDIEVKNSALSGQVIAFPTETVYGLGVIYDSQEAFDRLVKVKNRAPDKPFTLMLGDISNISKYAKINSRIQKLIDRFMPGEITLLLKPVDGLYPWVTLNSEYIGIRVPDYKEVCSLINSLNKPMLVTSANISGEPVCKDFREVQDVFDERVSLIVEGLTRSSKPSTIILCDEDIKLIREGSISFDDIKKVWEDE